MHFVGTSEYTSVVASAKSGTSNGQVKSTLLFLLLRCKRAFREDNVSLIQVATAAVCDYSLEASETRGEHLSLQI